MMLRTLTVSASSQERKYDFSPTDQHILADSAIELDNASITKDPQTVASFCYYDEMVEDVNKKLLEEPSSLP